MTDKSAKNVAEPQKIICGFTKYANIRFASAVGVCYAESVTILKVCILDFFVLAFYTISYMI